MTHKPQKTVDFGFREVPEEEKTPLVHKVFTSVSSRYDLMNDLMSGGLHRLWKRAFVDMLALRDTMQILDLAGGTGDIAFRLLKKAAREQKKVTVAVCDINENMLEEGRARAIDRNLLHNISWKCANAESLPFDDNSFDACTIAFGIRNITHKGKALAEVYRVLKPGGRFLCMEFSPLKDPLLSPLYDFYSFQIIPAVGEAITGNREAYQYLVESIRHFPEKEVFSTMLREADFARVTAQSLTGGIVAIHSGWKI